MKNIRVFVSVSEDICEIKNTVQELIILMNHHFKLQGVEFIPMLPEERALDGDLAVVLYGDDFGELPKECFEEVYNAFMTKRKPKIYVFFKEPSLAITEALKVFRDSFADKYGYFYCHFETVDSVKFQLAVQWLSLLQGSKFDKALRLVDSEIVLGEEHLVSLENLPFAKLNVQRQSLLRQIDAAEREISDLEVSSKEFSDNETIAETLRSAHLRHHNLKEELKHQDEYLFASAVFFVKESAERMDERVRKAYGLFEQGKVQAANRILNLKDLVKKDNIDKRLYDEVRKTRQAALKMFLQKGEIALSNFDIPLSERQKQAHKALEQALRVGNEIGCDTEEMAGIQEKLDAISIEVD